MKVVGMLAAFALVAVGLLYAAYAESTIVRELARRPSEMLAEYVGSWEFMAGTILFAVVASGAAWRTYQDARFARRLKGMRGRGPGSSSP